jgi:hypothetical protein
VIPVKDFKFAEEDSALLKGGMTSCRIGSEASRNVIQKKTDYIKSLKHKIKTSK